MAATRQELTALRSLISEADLILATTDLPQGRAIRGRELLRSAMALADDLVAHATAPAAALGREGGSLTAGKGSGPFRTLAAMRKTRAGGRPRKTE
jgi:prophage DNA circulation protein